MELKDVLIIVLPVMSALLGFYLSKRKEWELRISVEKTRRYENLITYLCRGFMDIDLPPDEKTKNKKEFYEQSYIVWLYASDEVIMNLNAFAEAFAQFSKKKDQTTESLVKATLRDLVHSMRKDTRGKTKLKSENFITTTVKASTN